MADNLLRSPTLFVPDFAHLKALARLAATARVKCTFRFTICAGSRNVFAALAPDPIRGRSAF